MLSNHLALLKPGQIATISQLHSEPGLHQRLLAMGFRSGRQIVMLRRGWLSGPLHVRIGTTEVMLRCREAREIEVTNVSTEA
ncbi:MAG: ferrous iron transport protein A [Nostocales cyanobacterium]|nr:MAG: ferrous iron transport protein A [Nostocales cyanobacterium]